MFTKNAYLNFHLHHVKICLQISSDYLEIFLLNKISSEKYETIGNV